MIEARITDRFLDSTAEFESFLAGLREEGAVVSFVGVARPTGVSGGAVNRLVLDHHPTLSEPSVREIALAAEARFEISAARVVHRYGEVTPGQAIVFVAAASSHRRAAFEAADYMMDRLKTEAMFWKCEDRADGAHWIEPTIADYAERARWSK